MEDAAAIDWITEQVLARGDELTPDALAFLLRRYGETGRDDISSALGTALETALDRARVEDGDRRSEWVSLLIDVMAISDDDRVPPAIVALVARLRLDWPARGDVAPAMRSIEACLSGASLLPDLLYAWAVVPAAVDELERVVHAVYQPGEGIAHTVRGNDVGTGTLGDHAAASSALLTAHAVTGRLPYAMLAEELMQFVRRTSADPAAGDLPQFIAGSQAARVFCRLASLRQDEDYRNAAVTAGNTDYVDAAERLVAALASTYRDFGADAAIYGLAISDLRSI